MLKNAISCKLLITCPKLVLRIRETISFLSVTSSLTDCKMCNVLMMPPNGLCKAVNTS